MKKIYTFLARQYIKQSTIVCVLIFKVFIISLEKYNILVIIFGHLRSFKGWIQTEACVIPSYHMILIQYQKQIET